MRPLSEFIVAPPRDGFVNPAVAHLLDVHEKLLVPEMSHRDPDGSVVLAPKFTRGPRAGWALYLPYEKNPLPLNRNGAYGGGWRADAAIVRRVRDTAYHLARGTIPPQDRIRVALEWEVTVVRTRDEDNLVKLMKHLTDGIRLAGVVVDDTKRYVLRDFPEINYAPAGPRRTQAHMHFRIETVTD